LPVLAIYTPETELYEIKLNIIDSKPKYENKNKGKSLDDQFCYKHLSDYISSTTVTISCKSFYCRIMYNGDVG